MVLLSLMACLLPPEAVDERLDADGDGFDAVELGGTDCNDADASIHPGATELCDDVDRNCDEEAGASDGDGDGFPGCEECDDANAGVNPNATEVCDDAGVDEDCDGLVNDADDSVDLSSGTAFYVDADGDGEGSRADASVFACELQYGLAVDNGDCDDTDPFIPMPHEWCINGLDENCAGSGGPDWECGQSIKLPSLSATFVGSDNSELGSGLVFLPDIDGDGLDDFALGSPGVAGSAGAVYLFSGRVRGELTPDNAFATLTGQRAGDLTGSLLATGDPDLDGDLELFVSAAGADLLQGDGAWFVVELDLEEGDTREITYGLPHVHGHSVGSVPWLGGINAMVTTSDTVVIGFLPAFGATGAVGAYTHALVGSDSLATADWSIQTSTTIVPRVGGLQYVDLDGDGVEDLVGAEKGGPKAGFILGPFSGVMAAEFDHEVSLEGQTAVGQPSAVGDFDGDGAPELALTSVDAVNPGSGFYDRLWILRDLAGEPSVSWQFEGLEDSSKGAAFRGLEMADVDDDTADDVIWGMSGEEMVWQIYSGLPPGTYTRADLEGDPSHAMVQIEPASTLTNQFGADLAVGGDVNGDGRPDVLIGDRWWGGPSVKEGRAWLMLGGRW